MSNVVCLNSYKMEKAYQQHGSVCIDLKMDTVNSVKKECDIAKELQLGYMRLLSNKQS